jgi:hypothetical protein
MESLRTSPSTGMDVGHECLGGGVTSRAATAHTTSRVTADSVKGSLCKFTNSGYSALRLMYTSNRVP